MRKGQKDFFKLTAILASVGLIVFGLITFLTWRSTPKVGKNVSSVEWLPDSASTISYVTTDGFGWYRYAEFTTTEPSIREFARKNGWSLRKAEGVFIGVRSVLGEPPLRELHGEPMDYVPQALRYERREDNGGGVTLVYDLDANRAYLHASHR